MTVKRRYLSQNILKDLNSGKMVFVGGPRQVGKTTMAKNIGEINYGNFAYLNWDSREDRQTIIADNLPSESKLIVFDELHKFRQWKNYVKGLYDKNDSGKQILVTGSARLDLYRRGGDSLMGRYHYYRLHPFSLREMLEVDPEITIGQDLNFLKNQQALTAAKNTLFKFGGFPEPLFAQDETVWRRFQNERLDRVIKEDIRELETLRDLSKLQILAELLPNKVSSLLSLNNLRKDLETTFKTISLWMQILENFYFHFRLYPYANSKIKSLRKQPKMYLWDWSSIQNENVRLENMVASHLLKFTHYLYDTQGWKVELFFWRDADEREVDFLVTLNGEPWLAIEVKNSDQTLSKSLSYFKKKTGVQLAYQLINKSDVDVLRDGIRIMSMEKFLSGLV
ncbi:MAG: ATP-binding protein [Candidatus Magasanikbacteria bacterium]|nr:ATP-binding protein [Candidatus Magasanikbacteria bacterium]